VQAVAFDFNGTLSDDEPVLARVYSELFAELGHPLTPGACPPLQHAGLGRLDGRRGRA
jgi:beta-phosphoglucomutase-like phosphatase (HAD superfamily)